MWKCTKADSMKLRPVLDGRWWFTAPNPDLTGRLNGDRERRTLFERGTYLEHNAPVDHHLFCDKSGTWHLWACVRATTVGRILYHWKSENLMRSPWEDTGEFIRSDPNFGECIDDWFGEEWLQSPYFVHSNDKYYMFYGGHRAGVDLNGRSLEPAGDSTEFETDESACQICLMTSNDGHAWRRHKNPDGTSRIFLGPGETRDPCVIEIDGLWHMYYAGYYDKSKPDEGAGFVVRTSRDLVEWSEWRVVHRDPQYGVGRTEAECPLVVYRDGYFYLFRTVDYYQCLTLVFRSEDPYDFGVGDASGKLVGRLPCAAPEIIETESGEFISSSHSPLFGEQMCRLKWMGDTL